MVLKKRSSTVGEEEEPKKKRKEDKSEESGSKRKSKINKEYIVNVKEDRLSDDDEANDEANDEDELRLDDLEHKDDGDTPWPQGDMKELFSRIEATLPEKDNLMFTTRADRLDWEEIAFNNYSPAECKRVWMDVQKKVRRYRLLREVVEDARQWLVKPWTNYYRAAKLNVHPDMPRRPLTTFMLFYLAKKDKVAAQHPNLDMTNVTKLVTQLYKKLSPQKKEKYVQEAAALQEDYKQKMQLFYEKHPEFTKDKRTQRAKATAAPAGLVKPRTPLQIFIQDRMDKLKDDPKFDKKVIQELASKQWKTLGDKKRLVWINWALEEETKYQEALKLYMAENPTFEPPPFRTVLKKDEILLRQRAAGKPSKPPNSAYSLYSRLMLSKCPELRSIVPKSRMGEISRLWHEMSEEEKDEYGRRVKQEQDKYKLEYATYLESLSEEDRQEELMRNQTKKKLVDKEVVNNGNRSNKTKAKKSNKTASEKVSKKPERLYFPGEPHQPPVNAYDLFVGSLLSDTKLSTKDAPRFWEMLPSSDKATFQRKLKDLKEKYIRDYRRFLKSLDEEQVAKYNELQKRNKENELASESKKHPNSDNNEDSDDSSSDDEGHGAVNNVQKDKGESDSDEEREKKSDSSSDSSSSTSGSSSSSSGSDDSDSSSDDSDEEDKKTNQIKTKKVNSDSDSSDDE